MRWVHGQFIVGSLEPDSPHFLREFAKLWGFDRSFAICELRNDTCTPLYWRAGDEWVGAARHVMIVDGAHIRHKWFGHEFLPIYQKANADKYDHSSADDMHRFMGENP